MQVVDPPSLPGVLDQLNALRSRHPGCAVLEVLQGLGQGQIRDLLAVGTGDFLRAHVLHQVALD